MSDELLNNDADVEESIAFCKELIDDVEIMKEKEGGGELPRSAREFAESVGEKVEGILDWMDTESHVTEGQISALNNIRGGVNRWLSQD